MATLQVVMVLITKVVVIDWCGKGRESVQMRHDIFVTDPCASSIARKGQSQLFVRRETSLVCLEGAEFTSGKGGCRMSALEEEGIVEVKVDDEAGVAGTSISVEA